jgi:hypothetical protein
MSSIRMAGGTFHGISVFGRGVFTDEDLPNRTYAGQCKDGRPCGLGVTTLVTPFRSTYKFYAEHGPDGQFNGRCLYRATGRHTVHTVYYAHYYTDDGLYERRKRKESADVFSSGHCKYNRVDCAPDDPRLLALIALVAPVEVRPAAPAPHPPIAPHSPPSNRPMDRPARFAPAGAGGRRGHRGDPPFPHAVAGGCATQPSSSHTAKHVHAVTRTRAFLR